MQADYQATVGHHVPSELAPVAVPASHRPVEGDEFVDGLVCRVGGGEVAAAIEAAGGDARSAPPTWPGTPRSPASPGRSCSVVGTQSGLSFTEGRRLLHQRYRPVRRCRRSRPIAPASPAPELEHYEPTGAAEGHPIIATHNRSDRGAPNAGPEAAYRPALTAWGCNRVRLIWQA
jgi:hypothetical protein